MDISLDDFRFSIPIAIRYGDMDTLAHVNNAKYLTYIEQARIEYMRDLGLWDGQQSEYGNIVARIEIDYKIPLTMGDQNVKVWGRCSRIGSKSYDILNPITFDNGDGIQFAAVAKVVMVCFNYVDNVTAVIPQSWRDSILAFEPALQG